VHSGSPRLKALAAKTAPLSRYSRNDTAIIRKKDRAIKGHRGNGKARPGTPLQATTAECHPFLTIQSTTALAMVSQDRTRKNARFVD